MPLFWCGFATQTEHSGGAVAGAIACAFLENGFVLRRLYNILDNVWIDRVVQIVVMCVALTNCGQRLPWGMRTLRNVSGNWIGVTRLINIKGAAGLAKHAINRIVIAITNCYQTAGGQGPLFIHKNIYSYSGYKNALQTVNVTKIVSCKQPTDALRRCLLEMPSQSPMHSLSSRLMFSSWRYVVQIFDSKPNMKFPGQARV